MTTRIKYLLVIIIFIFSKTEAQSIKFDKKSLAFLKTANKILVEFDYSDLTFNSGKIPEVVYLPLLI